MYTLKDIRHVHVEPTTRCNAACPMCARNARGSTLPGIGQAELTAADFRQFFGPDFLAQLTAMDFCGAYGDPALTRDLVEIIAYVHEHNPEAVLTMYTNGGIRSAGWWTRLAQALGRQSRVVFAIDGLADTNGTYRRGVDFAKVLENAQAFIDAGGDARWEFLAFRHNEHQVDEVRRLSVRMGFTQFVVKKTARFLEPSYDYVPEFEGLGDDLGRFPVYANNGTVVGHLEPPSTPTLVNNTTRHFSELLAHYSSLDELFSTTPIHCRILDTASLFVSATGHAYPCCWTYVQATRPQLLGMPVRADRQMYDLVLATGGFEAIDVRRGLRAAVESRLFAAVQESWSCSSVDAGRLKVCARACGTAFPAYFDQLDDPEMLPTSLRTESRSGDPGRVATDA
ncbi:radical SAM protein [Plantactinospora mayteni]